MKIYSAVLLCLLLFSGCSSPQKLYEKGKYDKAYDAVLGDLNKNKSRTNRVLLNKAFSKMIDVSKNKLNDLEADLTIKHFKNNLKEYKEVEKRYLLGESYLGIENKSKYENYHMAKFYDMDLAYDEGKYLLKDYDSALNKDLAREAYEYFSLIDSYNGQYDNLESFINESFQKGTVVYNIATDLNFDFHYRWDVNRRFDDIEGRVGFVQYVFGEDDDKGDCYIELDFSALDVDNTNRYSTQHFTKEIEDGYTTKVDTSGNEIKVPKFITIKGSVITNTRTKKLSWRVSMDIQDNTGNCYLRREQFYAEEIDIVEEYEIEGDISAVPPEYQNNNDNQVTDDDDMVDDLIDELYRQVKNYLSR